METRSGNDVFPPQIPFIPMDLTLGGNEVPRLPLYISFFINSLLNKVKFFSIGIDVYAGNLNLFIWEMGFPGFHVSTWGLLVSGNQGRQVAVEEPVSLVPLTEVKAFISIVSTRFIRGK